MLSLEKSELIERIWSLQTELTIPVETKMLRVVRAIVTSFFIVTVLNLYRKALGAHLPPVVNVLVEIALSAGVAYLVVRVWPRVRALQGRPEKLAVTFTRQMLQEMSLEELQGLEKDLALQVRERGDRAFFSEESEENVINIGVAAVAIVSFFFLYSVAMSFRGFGSIVATLLFMFVGSAVIAGLAAKYCSEPLRQAIRFLVRNREYIWYGFLVFGYIVTNLSAK